MVRTRVERRLISSTVPDLVAEAAEIAHPYDFVTQNGNPAEEIFQRLLRRKSNGEAADAHSGEQGREIEAQRAQYGENRQQENGGLEHTLAQNHERTGPHPSGKNGALPHASQYFPQDSPEQPVGADDRHHSGDLLVTMPLQHGKTNVAHQNAMGQRPQHQPQRARKRTPRLGNGMLPVARPEVPGQAEKLHYQPSQERGNRNRKQHRAHCHSGRPANW